MIVYANGPAAGRRGEFAPLPGVRSRVRAIPYPGLELPGADLWRGGYLRERKDTEVLAGPDSAEAWREVFAGAPPGCVLIGPVADVEPVYGAARAALAAAREAGRGAVIVDDRCEPDRLCDGPDVVRILVWRSEEGAGFWERAAGGRRGGKSGVALPLIPGWTGEPSFVRDFLARARSAGLDFVAPLEIDPDGHSRAAIHADFTERFPGDADSFFDRLHHRDWAPESARALAAFADEARAAGVPPRAPLPRGRGDYEANLLAREALEREADRTGEPGASSLRGAARRIEDLGRDLEELTRQGNGRLVLAPRSREWAIVEEAIGAKTAAQGR
ncbi:MAG: hypothetical protein ACRD16_00850 [Thermoanaerobaculia bacterium]